MHVSDVVQAIRLALRSDMHGLRVINIGAGKPTSVMEIATLLRTMLDSKSGLEVSGDFRLGDIRHCYADLSLARAVLGFRPAVSLESGLNRFVRWGLCPTSRRGPLTGRTSRAGRARFGAQLT